MTFCSSSKVAVFSLLTIDVDLCLNMSEDLNQIYCRRSLDMNSNSLESASNYHKRKNPEAKIPSSDTIFNFINCNNIGEILSAFRTINLEIFKMMELEGKVHDVAIDFHHVPFYGDKNT